jgi:hypothetical protein
MSFARVRLVCGVCNHPMGEMHSWDDGETFFLAAGVTLRGVAGPGVLAPLTTPPTAQARLAERRSSIHDVSTAAAATGVHTNDAERLQFVCRGRTHTNERTLRRETLWNECRRAIRWGAQRPVVML